jgi:hypothetical protein
VTDSPNRVPVGYIAGLGRSGSTLVASLVCKDDVVSVGELRYVWEAGVLGNETCGCGLPFRDCSFWRAVGDAAFGGWQNVPANELATASTTAFTPIAGVRALAAERGARNSSAALSFLTPYTTPLYRAILRVADARLVLDSTKNPSYFLGLTRMGFAQLRLIHLVRDSRAVAYSWRQRTPRPEVSGQPAIMTQYGYLHSSVRWWISNLMVERARRHADAYLLVRYEDFVTDLNAELERVSAFLGCEPPQYAQPGLAQHTLRGNPAKFQSDRAVRLDTRWVRSMPNIAKLAVTASTWPLLRHYGYDT